MIVEYTLGKLSHTENLTPEIICMKEWECCSHSHSLFLYASFVVSAKPWQTYLLYRLSTTSL